LLLYLSTNNICSIHKSLRTSPAQAAGVTDELQDMTHLCKLMDAENPSKKRGQYMKAVAA